MKTTLAALLAPLAVLVAPAVPLLADGGDSMPPFDFSDAFYLANGVDPATLIGRPTGSGPNSVMDNRENGPERNNVRLLQQAAAYDHSGHPIFFYVTGLPTAASFLDNAAGREAREIADRYKVYEFPRAGGSAFSVFPKRQDLIADLRNGYFSNNPLGVWQINIVRYTAAATESAAGRAALAQVAARNGFDLDGTPIIRTVDEIESLRSAGYVTITVPPADGGPGVLRWFFCPVLEDPRNGVIAPDAHLDVTGRGTLAAAEEFITLFNCLQQTGRECEDGTGARCRADCGGHGGSHGSDGLLDNNDFVVFIDMFFGGAAGADCGGQGGASGGDGLLDNNDFIVFVDDFFSGTGC